MPTIEQAGIVSAEGLHQARDSPHFVGSHQEMDVIGHQDVGMQHATVSQQPFPQALEVALSVLIIEKARKPVVAALHHMLRNTGEIRTRESSHGPKHHTLARSDGIIRRRNCASENPSCPQ